jgi:hypothetical protein
MTLFPQVCVVTGYPNQKGQDNALDLGFDIENYGHAYVSALGMEWMAEKFGYVKITEATDSLSSIKEELVHARERIAELEASVARIPQSVEGLLDGLKQLSVNAVNDLLGIASPSVDGDDDILATEGEPENAERPRPVVKTTGRNGKASS